MTTDYPAGELLLLEQVRLATGFAPENVTRGDWRFLNREGKTSGAVLRPGTFTPEYGEGTLAMTYRAIIEVFRKYVDDGKTLINLEGDVKNILNRLIPYRRMQDTTNTITEMRVIGGGEVMRIPPPPVGPHWLMQEIEVEWLEETPTTYQE